MEYSINWREEPWLLYVSITGVATADDYAALIHQQLRYLDGANGRLYWILDLRETGVEHGQPLNPAVMAQLMTLPSITHHNGGQFAMVCESEFMRFITSMIVQSPNNQRREGVPLRIFSTVEEAESFCREVGNVDGNRASTCTLAPE
jgi:hypothetical protein